MEKDYELQEEINQMDNAIDDIAAQRKELISKKEAIDQQVQMLDEEIKQRKRVLGRLKCSRGIAMVLCIAAVALLFFSFWYNKSWYFMMRILDSSISITDTEEGLALYSDYENKIEVLDSALYEELNALEQQRNDLQDELTRQQIKGSKKDSRLLPVEVDSTELTEQNSKELDAYIASLRRHPSQSVKLEEYNGVSYYEVAQIHNLDSYQLSEPGNTVIYPGSIIRGDTLMQGNVDYTSVSLNRTPMTLSFTFGEQYELSDVSYGTVQTAIEQMWAESSLENAQSFKCDFYSAQDIKDLSIDIGIDVGVDADLPRGLEQVFEFKGGDVGLDVSHSDSDNESTMLIVITEIYFTVKAEPLGSAVQYFQLGSDLSSLGDYEPAYVSSVDYGRRFIVEVKHSAKSNGTEVNAKAGAEAAIDVEAIKSEVSASVNVEAAISWLNSQEEYNCNVYTYGGGANQTWRAIDNKESSEAGDWLNSAAGGSLINPVPLIYHLNYLSDNSVVPAMVVKNDRRILAEDAKLVSIKLEGSVPVTFQLPQSANTIGYVVDRNPIQVTKDDKTSEEIRFIWDSSKSGDLWAKVKKNDKVDNKHYNLSDILNGSPYDNVVEGKKQPWPLTTPKTEISINITESVYEIQ